MPAEAAGILKINHINIKETESNEFETATPAPRMEMKITIDLLIKTVALRW